MRVGIDQAREDCLACRVDRRRCAASGISTRVFLVRTDEDDAAVFRPERRVGQTENFSLLASAARGRPQWSRQAGDIADF